MIQRAWHAPSAANGQVTGGSAARSTLLFAERSRTGPAAAEALMATALTAAAKLQTYLEERSKEAERRARRSGQKVAQSTEPSSKRASVRMASVKTAPVMFAPRNEHPVRSAL